MNLFHDNMDRAAQNFLKEIFGKDYEYDVTDGDMDEGWLDAGIAGSGDYEAYNVHVEYTKMSDYTFLTHIRIDCSFPDENGYGEVCGYDEPTETGDLASDFLEEVSDECRALFGGNGGADDFVVKSNENDRYDKGNCYRGKGERREREFSVEEIGEEGCDVDDVHYDEDDEELFPTKK